MTAGAATRPAYWVEEFDDAERARLEPWFTNTDGPSSAPVPGPSTAPTTSAVSSAVRAR